MNSKTPFQERLENAHDFPTSFTIKVLGPNNSKILSDVEKVVAKTLNDGTDFTLSSIESSKGNYTSIRIEFVANDAETVVELYKQLGEIEDAKYLL